MSDSSDRFLEWVERQDEYELLTKWLDANPKLRMDFDTWLWENFVDAEADYADAAYDAWKDEQNEF